MSVTDIVNREGQEYTVEEMRRVVEFYIYQRTNKSVTINFDNFIFPAAYVDQVQKLSFAFDIAKNYLLNL